MEILPPQDRNEFEAAADRAQEKARSFVAEGIADQAATERHAEAGSNNPGPVTALLDRIRAAIGAIRGD